MLSGGSIADPVLFWNDVALDAALVDSRAETSAQAGPTQTSRAMAIVHAAMFDAWNGVHREYEPYLVEATASHWASGEAAVAQAARDTLAALYPSQKSAFDRALTEYLDDVPNGKGEALGKVFGQAVAKEILQTRKYDGYDAPSYYESGTEPGQHYADPLNPEQGYLTPGWGEVDPFAIPSPDLFDMPQFPSMTSQEYAAALNEVRVKGALDAEVSDRDQNGEPDRSDEETEIGIFWGYDHRLGSPVRLYNQAVREVAIQQDNSVGENARLFALVHVAMADAAIAAWSAKYDQIVWRPIAGIREADRDGNPETQAEPDWTPLGAPANFGDPAGFAGNPGPDADPDPVGGPDFTPPFPAYTSGHATLGGAAFLVLASFYGTDRIPFSLHSEDSGTTRTFDSFSQAMEENSESRVLLGVHWRLDSVWGQAQGQAIASYVWANALQPLSIDTSHRSLRHA